MKVEKETLVLGVGNLLLKDEGVGIHVIKALENEKLPAHVHLMDGGTGGLHLLSWLQGYDRIIMIDATLDNNPPGTVRLIQPRYATDFPPLMSAHEIGLKDMIDAMILTDDLPNPSHCHLRPQYQRGRNGSDTRGKSGGSESDPDDTRDYFNT